MNQDALKTKVASEAIKFIEDDMTIGIGSGSTVNEFINVLASSNIHIDCCVSSSEASTKLLKQHGFQVLDLNVVSKVDVYMDGADEVNKHKQLIKGGGGALTREKILAAASDKFICIVDESKLVNVLGAFPIAVECIPMARSFVAREIVKLDGDPVYRDGVTTDNGNIILDVFNLSLLEPLKMERAINNIPGVVANGIFASNTPDKILIAYQDKVTSL